MSIQVMVNGIPGNMGRMVAETCVERGLFLVPYYWINKSEFRYDCRALEAV